MPNELIEKRIASIVQSPELKQFANRDGKALQINVQILGNDAIDRACADDGDVMAAMKYILSILPEPRIYWLKILGMSVALEIYGSQRPAARYLGFDRANYTKLNKEGAIDAIRAGEIIIKEQPEALQVPKGDEEV